MTPQASKPPPIVHRVTRIGASEEPLGDLRFRALLAEPAWQALPAAVRGRFSKRLTGGRAVVFTGTIVETHMSRAGWWLAQAHATARRRRCRPRATMACRRSSP